jgi:hypothetical protein
MDNSLSVVNAENNKTNEASKSFNLQGEANVLEMAVFKL